ncbi:(ABC) transporter [Linnemannia exigua]|uniref:(ABC) transporter n=1 Tax=Linnemannia exigua TaxID=604196 RepID=A0AAD4H3V4_9FUNG|nr:(ABC) transporter [Linnemannia exigua]
MPRLSTSFVSFALLMGDVINSIAEISKAGGNTSDVVSNAALISQLRILVIKFTIVGAVLFFVAYGQMCLFTLSAENQTKRIREKYLHAILRQDITWHDIGKKSESLNSRLSADTQLIFDGLADKVAAGGLMSNYGGDSSADGQDLYAASGGLAEQAIGNIRTVVTFGGLKRELQKFNAILKEAYKSGVKKSIATELGTGSFIMIMFMGYPLAFYYGSGQDGCMAPGDVLTVLFSTMIGAMSIGNVGPNIASFGKAQADCFFKKKLREEMNRIDVS